MELLDTIQEVLNSVDANDYIEPYVSKLQWPQSRFSASRLLRGGDEEETYDCDADEYSRGKRLTQTQKH